MRGWVETLRELLTQWSVHTTSQVNQEYTLSDGDVAGFDFNREIHFIKNNEGGVNKEPRITLKLHYVVYPKCLWPLGKLLAALTTGYAQRQRLSVWR